MSTHHRWPGSRYLRLQNSYSAHSPVASPTAGRLFRRLSKHLPDHETALSTRDEDQPLAVGNGSELLRKRKRTPSYSSLSNLRRCWGPPATIPPVLPVLQTVTDLVQLRLWYRMHDLVLCSWRLQSPDPHTQDPRERMEWNSARSSATEIEQTSLVSPPGRAELQSATNCCMSGKPG